MRGGSSKYEGVGEEEENEGENLLLLKFYVSHIAEAID